MSWIVIILLPIAIIGGLTAIGFLHSLGQAWVSRIQAGAQDPGALQARVDELEQRLDEAEAALRQLPDTEDRLTDMEERVEFSERLLQQLREKERLMPGGE